MRVRILANKPDGSPHPHAGKTGIITEIFSLSEPLRAVVKIDPGFDGEGNFIVVSAVCLEPIENPGA